MIRIDILSDMSGTWSESIFTRRVALRKINSLQARLRLLGQNMYSLQAVSSAATSGPKSVLIARCQLGSDFWAKICAHCKLSARLRFLSQNLYSLQAVSLAAISGPRYVRIASCQVGCDFAAKICTHWKLTDRLPGQNSYKKPVLIARLDEILSLTLRKLK